MNEPPAVGWESDGVGAWPRPLTSFVGRVREIEDVAGLLREHRLITLTGVGGCGKTRLAIEAVRRCEDRAVRWIDLGDLDDPGSVARTAADAVGLVVEPEGDPVEALARHLREANLLLCLDTCEHLLDPAAQLAERLLRHCPDVNVLATSREPLRVAGETVWRVPSLSWDDAVELFTVRARQAVAGVTLAHGEHVRNICARLDGIPLAIELAAAWIRVLTPAQIAADLDNVFDLLVGAPRGTLPRQQTLAASMRWSHALLEDHETVVFRRLGVFAGSFTLQAARDVCSFGNVGEADVLPILTHLVDKSLLVSTPAGDETRLRLLDIVRQYAQELLAEADEDDQVRDRHLAHFATLVEEAEPKLEEDQDTWRTRLDAEHANIRVALQRGLTGSGERGELGRRLAAAMARYWFIRGQAREGLPVLQQALDLEPDDQSALQARLLTGAAMLGMVSGRREYVADMATRAESLGISRVRGRIRLLQAFHQFFIDFQRCAALCREARELAGDDDPFTRDFSRVLEAYTQQIFAQYTECIELARQAYDAAMPRGDRFCAAFALGVELHACEHRGDLEQARTVGREALEILAPSSDYFATGTNTANLALVLAWQGHLDDALELMKPIVRSLDEPDVDVVGFHVIMGQIHLFAGNLETACRWAEQGTTLMAPDTDHWTAARCLPVLVESLRRLGRTEEAWRQARRGVELGRHYGAVAETVRALTQQARLAAEHDLAHAWDLQHESLRIGHEAQFRTYCVEGIEVLAYIAYRADQQAEAIRLLAASTAARDALGAPRPPVAMPEHHQLVERLREATGDSFDRLWTEGVALSLDESVAYASRGRGPRARPDSGWASLTPTELEVVQLVVEGLSNPEIGERLFVSRATVKTHLSHIYAKLGIANRTELATLASSRGYTRPAQQERRH